MTITQIPFGRTGHMSSRVLFGAAALSRATQDVADRTLDVLLEHGVNHIDVAASYGDAELRIAPWLQRMPGHFFLATKTGERRAEAAREELERSLERMGVDHVDLWQFHNLSDPIQWDVALSPGGVLDAAIQAREEGLIRYIGITGHGTHPYYRENFDGLVATCRERNVAVQTIKSIGYRPWMGRDRHATTWYEPLRDAADIEKAVHWALGREGIFVNSVGDVELLPLVLQAAESFERQPEDSEMDALVGRLEMEPLFV